MYKDEVGRSGSEYQKSHYINNLIIIKCNCCNLPAAATPSSFGRIFHSPIALSAIFGRSSVLLAQYFIQENTRNNLVATTRCWQERDPKFGSRNISKAHESCVSAASMARRLFALSLVICTVCLLRGVVADTAARARVATATAADDDGSGGDPCTAASVAASYGQPLHVAAVFIVFLASMLGAGLPLLPRAFARRPVYPFALLLGKCTGTGVVLACALVHMLQPAAESLTSACVPVAFSAGYSAYAYLFAMLAALAMHALEFALAAALRGAPHGGEAGSPASAATEAPSQNSSSDVEAAGAGTIARAPAAAAAARTVELCLDPPPVAADVPSRTAALDTDGTGLGARRTALLQAIMIEIGVTVHSVFIVRCRRRARRPS